MYTIAKHSKNTDWREVATGQVPADVDLVAWWAGSAPNEMNLKVNNFLGDLKRREMWLACNCLPPDKAPPLFSIAAKPKGGFTAKRNPDRPAHAEGCSHKMEPKEPPDDLMLPGGLPDNNEPKTPPKFVDLAKGGLLPTLPPSFQGPDAVGGSNEDKTDPLARQLIWLLAKSGAQRWRPDTPAVAVQALLAFSHNVPAHKDLPLSDLLYCNARAWHEGWMDKSFKACERNGIPPQAILICPALAADKKNQLVTLSEDRDPVPVRGKLTVYGDAESPARYPMLMIARVFAKDGGVEISRAYLHPIVNLHNWMLVDSDLEREALATITQACSVLAKREGIDMVVDKPVYNWGDTGARPDFVVQGHFGEKRHIVAVETMGTDEPEYVARKVGTVARLHEAVTVFEDKRYIQDGRVDTRLRNFLLANMTGALKPGKNHAPKSAHA